MKGISLPINMIVIIALAVIVLLSATAFFYSGFKTNSVSTQMAWNEACQKARQLGCIKDNFATGQLAFNDITGDGQKDDIQVVCKAQFGYTTNLKEQCWKQCCGNIVQTT